MTAESQPESEVRVTHSLDMRYRGQSYELTIPWEDRGVDFLAEFHKVHQQTYGYADPGSDVEIVNIRVRASGNRPQIALKEKTSTGRTPETAVPQKYWRFYLKDAGGKIEAVNAPFYTWEQLNPGDKIIGPALIVRNDTTILLTRMTMALLMKHNLIVTID
jgi:N-methylhydantoinase A